MTDETWSLRDLLLYLRKHKAQISVCVQTDGVWQNASLADLPPELWAKQMARFIEEGRVPVRVKTEAEQDAAPGDTYEPGA